MQKIQSFVIFSTPSSGNFMFILKLKSIFPYRSKLMDNKIEFPKNLPVSCLLGCVDVTDVLAQEEYRDRYPKGESNSPFVFVCQNPQELMIKFPMTGQHKICKLYIIRP